MSDINLGQALGAAFAAEVEAASGPEPYLVAKVTATTPTVTIQISGSLVNVPVPAGITLAWYTPAVGDSVVLARNGSAFIILGKVV